MKSIVRLWTLSVLLAASAASAEEQIPWARDFQSACELAAEQRRLVLIHFYNDNCPPCVRVEQNVFSQQHVAEAVALNYVPVKVHAGKNPQLAGRYQVMRWPTDVIVTPSGLEVYRAISPQKPDDYIALVNQVASQTGTSSGRQWKSQLGPATQRIDSKLPTVAAQTPAIPDAIKQFAASRAPQAGQQPASQGSPANSFPAASSPAGTNSAQPSSRLRSSYTPSDAATAIDSFVAPNAAPPSPSTPTASSPVAANRPPLPTENPWFTAQQPAQPPAAAAPPPAIEPQTPATEYRPTTEQFAASQPPIPQQPATPQAPVLPQRPNEQSYYSPAPEITSPPQAASSPTVATAGAISANDRPNLIPADRQPPVALGGHCPVTLLERSAWQKADPLYGAIHDGQTYLFVSAAEQQRFLADPHRYAVPPLGLDGYCPVTLRDNMKWQKADKQHFAIHRGRIYFFATAAAREQFLAAPDAYAPVLSGCDPVRFVQRGEVVDGKRSYGLITDKQIYLFADQQSLEAFERNPAEFKDKVRQAMAQVAAPSAYR